MRKADMIIDLQYGSTGKGLIAGYLANEYNYDVVVTANMPNAGHTYIDAYGVEFIHKVLPNGMASENVHTAMIGPGAVFDINRLHEELAHLRNNGYAENTTVYIHENAVVLAPKHKDREITQGDAIGSTNQGSGAALVEKIMRDPESELLARDVMSSDITDKILIVTPQQYREALEDAECLLLEAAQGFSLGISERFYPYCTSRDCTPARFMADMAIPLPMLNDVIGCARVHPIRVGGTSGGFYDDQEELTWEQLGKQPELTTVTKRVRRVFSYSEQQIEEAIMATRPDRVFLNFCNYDSQAALEAKAHIDMVSAKYGLLGVQYLGWGATHQDVEDNT